MAQNGTFPILNPYTPLAFLTPQVADTTSLYRYVVVGSLSVMIWDLLQAFPEDYRVIFRQKFSCKTIIFVVARIFTVAFFAMAAVFGTAQLQKCNLTNKVTWALYIVAHLATSLLLYSRLCTLFHKNYIVIGAFAFGLIFVIGGGITSVFATTGDNIGPTNYCILYVTGSYLWVTTMTEFAFDTSICGILIWKLDTISKEEHVGQKSVLQKVVQDGRLYLL
ncbi:hypothetical protein CPB83DRAFT_765984 [Crepidotus variabilis]|uniref:Uncharacterized protein n=1 Tax=Crepidotus variabilis TaxID=179855 RepID=A0A9P6EG95_9AGAR|nr:hypothetical protein CPB83DRAFT_765984 [Crepidotus variabilis]